jgi:predicted transcriptional regulator
VFFFGIFQFVAKVGIIHRKKKKLKKSGPKFIPYNLGMNPTNQQIFQNLANFGHFFP